MQNVIEMPNDNIVRRQSRGWLLCCRVLGVSALTYFRHRIQHVPQLPRRKARQQIRSHTYDPIPDLWTEADIAHIEDLS